MAQIATKELQQAIINGDIPTIVEESMKIALKTNASDIHFEARKSIVQIRIRIDGILQILVEYPLNLHPGIVSRVKIMSNLKIDESRIPQDGRINTYVGDTEVDMRTSTLPTPNGEKIVMRVVDKSKKIPKLEELGITGRNIERFKHAISQPNGIILTSGPTGAGKTTTMYSAMGYLNKSDVNIVTFEDPIENQMEGLNQSQVRPTIGYSFADGLRTALRQDPDIIMVGEIRDKETIDIAIEASLTGHLVLSTIHTNSAIDTITRILNMKIPDFLLTASVNLIIAQRLTRKLCQHCRVPIEPTAGITNKIQKAFEIFDPPEGFDMKLLNDPLIYGPSPDGCEHCEFQSYKGRIGIYEVLTISERLKKSIMDGFPSFELLKVAQEEGMVTLEQDGLLKVLEGTTSLEEVYKLIKT